MRVGPVPCAAPGSSMGSTRVASRAPADWKPWDVSADYYVPVVDYEDAEQVLNPAPPTEGGAEPGKA